MIEINKRRILEICRERISNLEIDEDFRTGESHIDIANKMFLIGNDISKYGYSKKELTRYRRYKKEN